KVNAEIPSSFTGTIQELIAEEGETVEVDGLIGYIDVEADEAEVSREEAPAAQDESEKIVDNSAKTSPSQQRRPTNKGQKNKTRYSSAIMHLANEYNLDLTNNNGTEARGRITRKDDEKYLSSHFSRNVDIPKYAQPEIPAPSDLKPGYKDFPLTGVRQL